MYMYVYRWNAHGLKEVHPHVHTKCNTYNMYFVVCSSLKGAGTGVHYLLCTGTIHVHIHVMVGLYIICVY